MGHQKICVPYKVAIIHFVCGLKYCPGDKAQTGGFFKSLSEPLTQRSNRQGSGAMLGDAAPW